MLDVHPAAWAVRHIGPLVVGLYWPGDWKVPDA